MKKAEISEAVREQTQAKPGSPEYLQIYQSACTKVIGELSDEERKEYEQLQEEWTNGNVPNDVRWRYEALILYYVHCHDMFIFSNAETSLAKTCKKFIAEMEMQMGAQVMVLVGWQDSKEQSHSAK